MSPRSAATAASMSASATSAAETVCSTSPSASSVVVVWPSRMVAAYDLSVAVSSPRILVARSMPTTSTPVAIGSSVPACPTLRVAKMRLHRRNHVVARHARRLVDHHEAGIRFTARSPSAPARHAPTSGPAAWSTAARTRGAGSIRMRDSKPPAVAAVVDVEDDVRVLESQPAPGDRKPGLVRCLLGAEQDSIPVQSRRAAR